MSRPSRRPTIEQIRDAIADRPGHGLVTLNDLARELHSSRSQLQRCLHESGTSFTRELRRERLKVATSLLRRGRSVEYSARMIGVSPDHLRRLFVTEIGIGPRDLTRCVRLLAKIHRWKQRVPPRFGTRWYWAQRRDWRLAHAELTQILERVHPESVLSAYAVGALTYARRPDYRRGEHRAALVDARRKEREALTDLLSDALASPAGAPESRRADTNAQDVRSSGLEKRTDFPADSSDLRAA